MREWLSEPHRFGHLIGFTKLTPAHDFWIRIFIERQHGSLRALMAHRGSYKTTCGIVAMILLMMLYPNIRILIARKTEDMAKKLLQAIDRILDLDIVRAWMFSAYGVKSLRTDRWTATQIRLAITTRIRPEPTLTAVGMATAQTGDHYDYVWLDDVITVVDRYSAKERERTRVYIHEIASIVEPTGVRMLTGTPWHERDGFEILQSSGVHIHRFPIGSIEIAELTPEVIAEKKRTIPLGVW
ncbi:MAG: hypothetical protein ONA90_01265, partial [candidate division KSB1 bacterium]|nr:hypothetical protein [candidate division KSB1 bacterium]